MASQVLPLNVLDPMYTRYIPVGSDLEQVLVERYGDKYDFEISHQSDRWVFRAPEELDRKQLKYIIGNLCLLLLTSSAED
ncbi:hypothetical protein E2P81_ATG11864 [Venturia nashicola]|nr:hypothetical protein E2P81_ATG11864 [Venturia nashicola]